MADRVDPRVARTRERVLAAGQQLLIAEGLDAVTHQRVAAAAGVGRRTLYRHWPDHRALLHEVLAQTRAPAAAPGVGVVDSIVDHLLALDAALHDGPLAYILAALAERATHDPEFASLHATLTAAGCAPLEALVARAISEGALPATLDVDVAVARLEGPVFHSAMVRRRRFTADQVRAVVGSMFATPPLSVHSVPDR